MEKGEGKEKRAAPRVKKEVIVQYKIKELPPEGVEQTLETHADITRTKDLSEKGVSFTASYPVPTQSILDIKLRLPLEKDFLELEGRVVGCEEIRKNFIYGVRVEFINLGQDTSGSLKKFVQSFLKT